MKTTIILRKYSKKRKIITLKQAGSWELATKFNFESRAKQISTNVCPRNAENGLIEDWICRSAWNAGKGLCSGGRKIGKKCWIVTKRGKWNCYGKREITRLLNCYEKRALRCKNLFGCEFRCDSTLMNTDQASQP